MSRRTLFIKSKVGIEFFSSQVYLSLGWVQVQFGHFVFINKCYLILEWLCECWPVKSNQEQEILVSPSVCKSLQREDTKPHLSNVVAPNENPFKIHAQTLVMNLRSKNQSRPSSFPSKSRWLPNCTKRFLSPRKAWMIIMWYIAPSTECPILQGLNRHTG